jgi:hypothetical protein
MENKNVWNHQPVTVWAKLEDLELGNLFGKG